MAVLILPELRLLLKSKHERYMYSIYSLAGFPSKHAK